MSRKSKTEQKQQTNYQGAFMTPPRTEEDEAVAEWAPDRTLLDAGTKASYGAARQGIVEGAGGYSGITNPVVAARMQQIGLQELADRESSAIADAAAGDAETDLRRRMFLAAKRSPQYTQTGTTGTGTTTKTEPFNWGALLGGGLGLASAFIKPM